MKHCVVHILSVMALLGTVGCTLAPRYEQPDSAMREHWPLTIPSEESAGAAAAELEWNRYFLDPILRAFIADALEYNRDLRMAVLNVEKSRAQYGIRRADIVPTLSIGGEHASTRVAEDLSTRGESYIGRQYSVNAGLIGYELDLFGRVRSLSSAALETYLATEEAARSARIALIAQVATAYLGYVADRELLDIAQDTLTSQLSSYAMIKRRYEEGISSELDVRRAETTVSIARSDLALYTAQTAEDINALSVLLGRPVSESEIPPAKLADLPSFPVLAAGMPSEILLTRPDIRQREHVLRAANANIGAARANFFPSISLTATLGRGSVELNKLFDGGNRTWAFAPSVYLPIFDMGRNWAQLKMSEADQKIAVAEYDKSVQLAFREVADALIRRVRLEERLAAQRELLNASTAAYRLSDARYRRGIDNYLSVLDAQRSVYAARQAAVAAELGRNINLVELYKVLGGGLR